MTRPPGADARASVAEKTFAPEPMSPFRRLGVFFQPDRADLLAVLIFSVVTGGLLLATPVAVQALVDFVAFGAAVPSIAVLAILLFIALGAGATVVAIQNWIVEILQRRIFARLVASLAERLPRLSWRVRDHYHQPELVNRFFDIVTIQKVGSTLVLDGLANLLSVGVGISVLAFYHPILLAFDIGLLALMIVLFFLPLKRGVRTAITESSMKYEMAGWLEELARHRVTFRYAGSEFLVRQRSEEITRSYLEARRKHYSVVFGQIIASLGLQVVASTVLLGLGGWLVVKGELTLGQLVAAELLVVLVVSAVAKLGKLAEKLYDLFAAVDKVGKLLDLEVEVCDLATVDTDNSGPSSLRVQELVLPFDGVHLRKRPVDFDVKAGSIVGITGKHGAGKSVLLEVLYRLREPKSGAFLIDDRHAADFATEDFRSRVALASGIELLEASILENVALGRPQVSMIDVEEALRTVGLLDELQRLPDGLQTWLRPNGAPLSRSQQGRLIMARALAGRPSLLLVDELLDDLSDERLATLKPTFLDGREARTLVIASDRSEVLASCDHVLDLSDGEES